MGSLSDELGGLEMGILPKIFKKVEENPKMTRRGFLGSAVKTGVAATGIGVAADFLKPEEAETRERLGWKRRPYSGNPITKENYIEGLPAGIKLSTRPIQIAWLNRTNLDIVRGYMAISKKRFQDNTRVDLTNEPRNDPATYLVLALESLDSWEYAVYDSYGNLPRDDPMVDWAIGINNYVDCYVRNRPYSIEGEIDSIEKPFLQAIFKCAGRSERDVEAYMDWEDLYKKSRFLTGIKNTLLSRKTPQREKMIAEWSAVWLGNFYCQTGRKEEEEMMFPIEIDVSRKVGRVRAKIGGPYYFSKKEKI